MYSDTSGNLIGALNGYQNQDTTLLGVTPLLQSYISGHESLPIGLPSVAIPTVNQETCAVAPIVWTESTFASVQGSTNYYAVVFVAASSVQDTISVLQTVSGVIAGQDPSYGTSGSVAYTQVLVSNLPAIPSGLFVESGCSVAYPDGGCFDPCPSGSFWDGEDCQSNAPPPPGLNYAQGTLSVGRTLTPGQVVSTTTATLQNGICTALTHLGEQNSTLTYSAMIRFSYTSSPDVYVPDWIYSASFNATQVFENTQQFTDFGESGASRFPVVASQYAQSFPSGGSIPSITCTGNDINQVTMTWTETTYTNTTAQAKYFVAAISASSLPDFLLALNNMRSIATGNTQSASVNVTDHTYLMVVVGRVANPIVLSPQNLLTESGCSVVNGQNCFRQCPSGYYWTDTSCVLIPRTLVTEFAEIAGANAVTVNSVTNYAVSIGMVQSTSQISLGLGDTCSALGATQDTSPTYLAIFRLDSSSSTPDPNYTLDWLYYASPAVLAILDSPDQPQLSSVALLTRRQQASFYLFIFLCFPSPLQNYS